MYRGAGGTVPARACIRSLACVPSLACSGIAVFGRASWLASGIAPVDLRRRGGKGGKRRAQVSQWLASSAFSALQKGQNRIDCSE